MDAAAAVSAWHDLETFSNQWFSYPDTHALEMALCCYAAHSYLKQNPVWLFVIGPPGTGKTGFVIQALSELPNTYILGDVNHQSFLSGFGRGRATNTSTPSKYSLLEEIGSGTILFKDFTTILSKRPEQRAEVIADLREIHDGVLTRRVASSKKITVWGGKITVIAACTPALEQHWAVMRELGDRFMAVRWPRGDGIHMATMAIRQIGYEESIRKNLRDLVLRVMDPTTLKGCDPPPENDLSSTKHLVEMAALLRIVVQRDMHGTIRDVGEAEGTSRLIKAVVQLAQARAILFRKPAADLEDVKRCRRIIWDALPRSRQKTVEMIPDGATIMWADLVNLTGLAQSTLHRTLEDLLEIGVLQTIQTTSGAEYQFSPAFQRLKSAAFS